MIGKGNDNYSRWLADNRPPDPHGQCEALTKLMAAAFPELRRVRGHYICPLDGRLPHWWMMTPEGRIIDPTSAQFSSRGNGSYEEHVGPEPTGKCPNCGELLYDAAQVCSDKCGKELTEDLESS